MGIFDNIDKYLKVHISEYIKSITQPIQAGGLTLDAKNNYDIENRKLVNVAEGTFSNDAITKHQLDTTLIDKHGNNQNIDLKGTYKVINSKQQTFNDMNASRNTLVCYEDVSDVFVSGKELDNYLKRDGSSNMTGDLQMNNSTIKGLPTTTPQSGDEATSKDHVLTLINNLLMFI